MREIEKLQKYGDPIEQFTELEQESAIPILSVSGKFRFEFILTGSIA